MTKSLNDKDKAFVSFLKNLITDVELGKKTMQRPGSTDLKQIELTFSCYETHPQFPRICHRADSFDGPIASIRIYEKEYTLE